MLFLEKHTNCIDDEQLNKTTQSNVVLNEKGRRYCLKNTTRTWQVTKVKIEKCVINIAGEKACEAILIAEKENINTRGYYVELKGISVGDAFKQIENSLNRTAVDLPNVILFGRVIPSAYKKPDFLKSQQQRLVLRFKGLGGDFIVRENYEDEI
ncbi:MAG: hypothetical protein ABIO79_06540 [Ferruginibacter sp.]